MARKPNYSYERMQRDRAKAEKREAKAVAKAAEKARGAGEDGTGEPVPDAVPEPAAEG